MLRSILAMPLYGRCVIAYSKWSLITMLDILYSSQEDQCSNFRFPNPNKQSNFESYFHSLHTNDLYISVAYYYFRYGIVASRLPIVISRCLIKLIIWKHACIDMIMMIWWWSEWLSRTRWCFVYTPLANQPRSPSLVSPTIYPLSLLLQAISSIYKV